jgi:hypothetical protein
LLFGVEFGGGESKNLRLFFGDIQILGASGLPQADGRLLVLKGHDFSRAETAIGKPSGFSP